jgi:hypothetical protein
VIVQLLRGKFGLRASRRDNSEFISDYQRLRVYNAVQVFRRAHPKRFDHTRPALPTGQKWELIVVSRRVTRLQRRG